jgi:hypothetical protein
MIAANEKTITALGTEDFQATQVKTQLEDILDEGDNIFTDCFVWQEQTEDPLTPAKDGYNTARTQIRLNTLNRDGEENIVDQAYSNTSIPLGTRHS